MSYTSKTKPKKAKALVRGGHPASIRVSVAIVELVKVRRKQAILKKRSALLVKMIKEGGCGVAHGYRAYVSFTAATTRVVHVKASESVRLVKCAPEKEVAS